MKSSKVNDRIRHLTFKYELCDSKLAAIRRILNLVETEWREALEQYKKAKEDLYKATGGKKP